MNKSIEDARALLGVQIALLAHDTRYDPGQTNLLEENVLDAADDYARAVLGDMPDYFDNGEDNHICPDAINKWVDKQNDQIQRLRDAQR